MSSRPILSRPRTRIYDANYNIGENYYKSAIDRLDRKYSGRPLSPPPRQSTIPDDILERHDRAFADENLTTARRRAEKHIKENTLFDSRGGRLDAHALEFLDSEIGDEIASKIKRIRESKKVSTVDDLELESAVNNINTRRLLDRSEKLLDSVGITDNTMRKSVGEEMSIKRRSLRVASEDDLVSSKDLTKWSAIKEGESSASLRAKQSRARLNDLEEEMGAMAEKQAARERRVARLRALVAETADEPEQLQSSFKSVRIRARQSQETADM